MHIFRNYLIKINIIIKEFIRESVNVKIMTTEFAQLCSIRDQRPKLNPTKIELDQQDAISGIEHYAENPADIRVLETGTYVVIVAPQVGRSTGTTERYIDVWLRKNGEDIPNSNVRRVLGNSKDKDVLVCQTMLPFKAGDIINIMMSVEVPNEGLGIEAIRPNGEPVIPSIIYSMHKIGEAGRFVSTGRGQVKFSDR